MSAHEQNMYEWWLMSVIKKERNTHLTISYQRRGSRQWHGFIIWESSDKQKFICEHTTIMLPRIFLNYSFGLLFSRFAQRFTKFVDIIYRTEVHVRRMGVRV